MTQQVKLAICTHHWIGLGAILFAAPIITGCASQPTVVSQPVAENSRSNDSDPGGLIYSLPKSVITVTGERTADGTVKYTITGSILPDTTARFRLRHIGSIWRDDDVNLQVDRNGLLTSGRSNITDRTAEVGVQLARSAGAIAAAVAGPFSVQRQAPRPAPSPYPFTRVLEVSDLVGGASLPDGSTITLRGDVAASDRSSQQVANASGCNFSVCYRTVMQGTVKISSHGRSDTEAAIVLVNPYRIEGVDLRGAPLVARTNNLTFDNGLLTGQAMVIPSSAVAAASIPYDLIHGFFSAFGEILTLRVNNTSSEASLIAAQTAIVNNTAANITAVRALQTTQSQGQQIGATVVGLGSSP